MGRWILKAGLRQSIMRLFLRAGLAVGLSLAVLVIFYVLDPIGFRAVAFEPVRELYFFNRELGVVSDWQKIRKVSIEPAQTISIPTDHQSFPRIAADLRIPDGEGKRPAILLLHGSAVEGRKSGLIQLLGQRFQEAGWIVLAPDARGFGDSETPPDVLAADSWRTREDTERAIRFLWSHPRTDRTRIFVLGHSMGAGHALEGALENPHVKALVLIGPPRYPEGTNLGYWFRVRFSAVRNLDEIVPEEVVQSRIVLSNLEEYTKNQLKDGNHKPILLIDGESEGPANLGYLSRVASEICPPFRYRTLPATGHYCGVYNLPLFEGVYYRSDLFEPFFSFLLEELSRF